MSDETSQPTPDSPVAPAADETGASPVVDPADSAAESTGDRMPEGQVAQDAEPAPAPESAPEQPEPTPEPEPHAAQPEPAPEAAGAPAGRPGPPVPSPAALAGLRPRPQAPSAPPQVAHPVSESARFGRVAEDGTVFVTVGEEEREVGSYPGASAEDALQYFARKYDELASSAQLLRRRLELPEVSAKEVADGLTTLRQHIAEAHVVGDLAALDAEVSGIEEGLRAKRETENAQRAEARAQATQEREAIVAEAEKIAGQPPANTQWKQSGERMRALLDQWKQHQRSGPKLDKPTENALWQRFSHARNAFDKGRRTFFAQLDTTRAEARSTKESLVREAESLASSRDWGPTARAFKQLMDEWRRAGRAARNDDDALWERFKAAQDTFFNAKDEVAAAEDKEFRANLAVKEDLLREAEAILPVTDLDAAKTHLRHIQDKWDKAGKVPRADMDRIEKAFKRVESAVRDAEDKRWKSTNPEVAARATSMVTQLESNIESLRTDLAKAESAGNEKKAADVRGRIEAQEQWLAQARASLDEFSG